MELRSSEPGHNMRSSFLEMWAATASCHSLSVPVADIDILYKLADGSPRVRLGLPLPTLLLLLFETLRTLVDEMMPSFPSR